MAIPNRAGKLHVRFDTRHPDGVSVEKRLTRGACLHVQVFLRLLDEPEKMGKVYDACGIHVGPIGLQFHFAHECGIIYCKAWGDRPPLRRPRSGVPLEAVGGPDAKLEAWGDRPPLRRPRSGVPLEAVGGLDAKPKNMRFSHLADVLSGTKNPLYQLHDELRSKGNTIIDLVRGSVNEHGIVYPLDVLTEILWEAAEEARTYRPDSFGQPVSRQAVARYYNHPGIRPENVVITPGTSISYWYVFKLLAEPGDEILSPQPSYPLFDYIAKLCDVTMTNYRLAESREWSIDLDHLEHQITGRTRAIVLISPHNPTGMVADEAQVAGLAEVAFRHELPIIADEVFSEFLFALDKLPRPAVSRAPLVFTLNGFSKMFALPGIKFGWMAISGEQALVKRAMAALEMISDTFLPVNEIVQFSAPRIFERGRSFQRQYIRWVRDCFDHAMGGLTGVDFVRPRGGFYVTVPTFEDEDKAATDLLREHGVLTHPGYFYDIQPNHLVMTFIHDPQTIMKAFRRISLAARLS